MTTFQNANMGIRIVNVGTHYFCIGKVFHVEDNDYKVLLSTYYNIYKLIFEFRVSRACEIVFGEC